MINNFRMSRDIPVGEKSREVRAKSMLALDRTFVNEKKKVIDNCMFAKKKCVHVPNK